jgi:hypothetical protein
MKSYPSQLNENEILMEAADNTLPRGAVNLIAQDISRSADDREMFELFQASSDLMNILRDEIGLLEAIVPIGADVSRPRE